MACAPGIFEGIAEAFRGEGVEIFPLEIQKALTSGFIGLHGGVAMSGVGTCGAITASTFLISYVVGVTTEELAENGNLNYASCVPAVTYIVDRFEETYGATDCLRLRYNRVQRAFDLLDPDAEGAEVYCEHYEDILIALRSGKFRGIQVKTKTDNAGPLKGTDAAIVSALIRFVQLDLTFPGSFDGFVLATNVPFDRAGRGHGNLHTVVNEAKAHSTGASVDIKTARSFCKTVLRKYPKRKQGAKGPPPTEKDVLAVLTKLDLHDELPKLPDIRHRVLDRLVKLSSDVAAATWPVAQRVVDELERLAFAASSRADEDQSGRYWFMTNPTTRAALRASATVQAKLLSRELVESAISKHCAPGLVASATPVSPEDIPQDLGTLEKKLIAGGLSTSTISMACDAVASVELHGTELLHVHGSDEGLRRYNHTRAVVKKECALAYESQATGGRVEGPKMLTCVEARLRQRRREDSTGVLARCQDEHLLGYAFVLTEECTVWWSETRELEPRPDLQGNQRDE